MNDLFSNTYLFLTMVTVIGLLMGSFLNVVIYRLPLMIHNENRLAASYILDKPLSAPPPLNLWRPRSFCPFCRKRILFRANISLIGYLMLRGKALCCQNKIPPRYLIVESTMGILSLLLAIHYGPSLQLLGAIILLSGLIVLFFIDIDTLLLPDQITQSLLWLGLFFNIFHVFTSLQDAVLGAIVGYLFFSLVAKIFYTLKKKDGLGQGDFKLLALLGAWQGWTSLPLILFMSSMLGSFWGLLYILNQKKEVSTLLPFGPFLALAGFLTLIYGERIMNFFPHLTWH